MGHGQNNDLAAAALISLQQMASGPEGLVLMEMIAFRIRCQYSTKATKIDAVGARQWRWERKRNKEK